MCGWDWVKWTARLEQQWENGMNASLKDRLVGTWMLQSYIEHPIDGSPDVFPLGPNAVGIIIYTSDGYMSVQLMREGRPLFSSGDWFEGTHEDYRAAAATFVAHSGTYRVDEKRSTLTQTILISFFPNWGTQSQTRFIEIENDELRLSTVSPMRSNGKMVMSYLTWRRAGQR